MNSSIWKNAVRMTCPTEAEWIDFASETLDAGPRRESMEEHLAAGCAVCAEILSDAQAFLGTAQAEPPPAKDLDKEHRAFQDRFALAPESPRRMSRTLAWPAIAAGLAIATGAAFWVYLNNVKAEEERISWAQKQTEQTQLIARLEKEAQAPRVTAGGVFDLYPEDFQLRGGGSTQRKVAEVKFASALTFLLHLRPKAPKWDVEVLDREAKVVSSNQELPQSADGTIAVTVSGIEPGQEYEIRARSGEILGGGFWFKAVR